MHFNWRYKQIHFFNSLVLYSVQFNGKINFLNSSVPIPNTLSDELASKITNLVGYYENQLSQLNRELVGCQQFDYQTNCSTVGARLKVITHLIWTFWSIAVCNWHFQYYQDLKENFRKDLIKLREQALSLNELKTVRPKIFTNGIFFDRVFNIFNDYTLHLEFAVSGTNWILKNLYFKKIS